MMRYSVSTVTDSGKETTPIEDMAQGQFDGDSYKHKTTEVKPISSPSCNIETIPKVETACSDEREKEQVCQNLNLNCWFNISLL